MTRRRILFVMLSSLAATGCADVSGFVPSLGSGPLVSPAYLASYRAGGSMSTLWYLGSDKRYHYFSHYVKTESRYRVPRDQLLVPGEFSYGKRKPLYVGSDMGGQPAGIEWPKPEQ